MKKLFILLAVMLVPIAVYAGFNDRFSALDLTDITATSVEINQYPLTVDMTDVSTSGSVYVVVPHAGRVAKIQSVISAQISSGDAGITAAIGTTNITGGTITIASGSTAGTVDSCVPTALNTVVVGDVIRLTTDGVPTNVSTTARGTYTILITR